MITAAYTDKERVVDILTKAFDTNKSVNAAIIQDGKRKKRIRALMEYSFDQCWYFGEIYLTDDKSGVMLLLYPDRKKLTFRSVVGDILLIFKAIGISRVSKVLDKESKIKGFQPAKCIRLWYIGVTPSSQGSGKGSLLLNDLVRIAKNKKLPVYLETSMPENLAFYKKFGFEIFKEIDFEYKLYLLRKDSESLADPQ